MKKLLFALGSLLLLTSLAAAVEPQQGPPDFGLDKSGAIRQLNLRDQSTGERLPMGGFVAGAGQYLPAGTLRTISDAANYHPRIAPEFIRTQGYSVVGTGGALYRQEASAPSHAFKFSITTAASATVWYGIAPSERPVSPEMIGAIGDDAIDDTTAVTSTIAAGFPISGFGKVYRVSGSINLKNGIDLRDATFLQTSTATDVRTLTDNCACSGPYTLRRVKIDHSLRAIALGTVSDTAGIYISANGGVPHDILFEDVEVTGGGVGGAGSGIFFANAVKVKVIRPHIHDFTWGNTTGVDPGIERMQGIRCSTCTDFELIEPNIHDLYGTIPWVASQDLTPSQGFALRTNGGNAYRVTTVGGSSGTIAPTCTGTPGVTTCSDGAKTWTYMGSATTFRRSYQIDCIDASWATNYTVRGGTVRNCSEGIDISGNGTNTGVKIFGTTFVDMDAYGVKFCHNAIDGGAYDVTVYRAGIAAFILCAGLSADPGTMEHITFSNPVAIDIGNGYWGTKNGMHVGGPSDPGREQVDIKFINPYVWDDGDMASAYFNGNTTPDSMILVNPRGEGWASSFINGPASGRLEMLADGSTKVTGLLTAASGASVSGGLTLPTGFFAMTRNTVPLTSTPALNSNIPVARSVLSVTGPTGPFSLGGFVAQADGTYLRIANSNSFAMTIVNEDASSTAANRIKTFTGKNEVLPATQSFAEFVYNNANSRWSLLNYGPLGTGTGIAGLGTAATVDTGTSGATIPLLNGANIATAQNIFRITSAGAQSIPIAIQNQSNTAATEVAIDFSPNTNGIGGRSAQIGSLTTAGSDASLVLRTADGTTPADRLTISGNGTATFANGVVVTGTTTHNGATTFNAATTTNATTALNGTTTITTTTASPLTASSTLDTAAGTNFVIKHSRATQTSGDGVGNIYFQANDSGGTLTNFGQIEAVADTITDGAEAASIRLRTGSSPTERLRVGPLGVQVGTGLLTDPGAGNLRTQGGVQIAITTVAGLPTCNAGLEGMMRGVSDANSTTYHATAAGSGANHMPVYCDGTNWVLH